LRVLLEPAGKEAQEKMNREQIKKELEKKATYGQFHTENCVQGGWFIWLMDAVDVVEELVNRRHKK
jgi:hypothetical protein